MDGWREGGGGMGVEWMIFLFLFFYFFSEEKTLVSVLQTVQKRGWISEDAGLRDIRMVGQLEYMEMCVCGGGGRWDAG